MEHSKTPWRIEPATKKDNWRIIAANNQVVSTFSGNMDMDNARRIVACVNACAGLSTENLEQNKPLLDGLRELNRMVRGADQRIDQLQTQLATERASLFAENQRKQQLEQQVAELVGVLEAMLQEVAGCYCTTEAAARAVIQKVRGGE